MAYFSLRDLEMDATLGRKIGDFKAVDEKRWKTYPPNQLYRTSHL
jgi:hypothetical protein